MNIIKLQNMLRGVADEALIGYVQNPTGEVPSYLALSELQRRKDTRAKYQADQAPETSVAEDITQAQPGGLAMLAKNPVPSPGAPMSQGVADLPVSDDMYQEDSFAAGGIVAFDDGGEVQRFVEGGTSRLEDWYSNLRAKNLEKQEQNKRINQLLTEKYRLQSDFLSRLKPEQKAAQDNAIKQIDAMLAEEKAKKASSASNAPTAIPSDKVLGSQAAADATIRGSLGTPDVIPTYVPPATTLPPPPPPVVNPYGIDTSIPRPLSVEDAMKRQDEAMRLAGVDPDFYKKQAADLLEQREALKADRSEAGNLALIRAGLATMGGTSPFALVNLGKGAEAGVEQYMQDARNIRTENRLLKQADLKLKEAQNAQQRGDAQGAIKAIQERENLIAQYNHYKMTTGATLKAAEIAAGTRTGMGQLPALYRELNKAQQAGNQTLADQIQARIDDIAAGGTGGASSSAAGWGNFTTVKPAK